MKVLLLSHEFPPVGGGASPVVSELGRQLVRMEHAVDVVTMRYDRLPRSETVEGVQIYRTPALRARPDIARVHELATYVLGALGKTLSLIRRRNYDIIHCHFIVPAGPLAWAVAALTRTPFLITCHGSDVPTHNPERFVWMHRLIAPAWRFVVRRTPVLVSPSASLRERILRNCPQAHVRVIPNGIHLRPADPAPKQKRILMCGRIYAFKGFQYAIEAIRQMDLDWPVDVVGDGPYMPELKRKAEGAKTPIRFWGWLDKDDPQFAALFHEASIFVFPSEAENFPSVLLEAMAAGMAIITTTAAGCPEVVGEAAVLVPPRNAPAIGESLQGLVESRERCEELSRAALARVKQFAWERVAAEYVSCYRQVMDEAAAGSKRGR